MPLDEPPSQQPALDVFGLDRCSIYLAGEVAAEARLVATYEDPTLRNLVVDLDRYPGAETGFRIRTDGVHSGGDAGPAAVEYLAGARRPQRTIDHRRPHSVAHEHHRRGLSADRTRRHLFFRGRHSFLPAHRFAHCEGTPKRPPVRDALIAFLRRLLDRHATHPDQLWAEPLLARSGRRGARQADLRGSAGHYGGSEGIERG